jgi:hypothetical protein
MEKYILEKYDINVVTNPNGQHIVEFRVGDDLQGSLTYKKLLYNYKGTPQYQLLFHNMSNIIGDLFNNKIITEQDMDLTDRTIRELCIKILNDV